MSDNRTTELLRKLLDERGVKYSDFTSATRNGKAIFKTRWKHERGYAELSEWESTGSNNLFIQNVDPEQAIAATLGEEKAGKKSPPKGGPGPCSQPSDDIIHDAATLGGGKLTAEQVRETVEKHWHDLTDEYDMPEATALPECSYDWQAIADELNARAVRTCKLIRHGSLANMPSFVCWSCSECGFGWHHSENDKQFSFCPNCGAKVVDA